MSALREVDAAELVLYSVSIAEGDDAGLDEVYQKIDKGDLSLPVLSPMATVGQTFPLPASKKVRILVRIPSK